MRRDRLDVERAEHERQDERGRRVAVVDDDLEAARPDRVARRASRAGRARSPPRRGTGSGSPPPPPRRRGGTPGGRSASRSPSRAPPRPGRRAARRSGSTASGSVALGPTCSPASKPSSLEQVPVDRRGHDAQVGDVDAARLIPTTIARRTRRQAVGDARLVTIRAPRLQRRSERDAEPQRRLGREVDVDEAADALTAEDGQRGLRASQMTFRSTCVPGSISLNG